MILLLFFYFCFKKKFCVQLRHVCSRKSEQPLRLSARARFVGLLAKRPCECRGKGKRERMGEKVLFVRLELIDKQTLADDEGKFVAPDDRNYYKYRLVGIIVHTGTAETGHYYAFVKERVALANAPQVKV